MLYPCIGILGGLCVQKREDAIAKRAADAVKQISDRLHPCPDLRSQPFTSGHLCGMAVWLDGLVDDVRLQEALVSTSHPRADGKGRRAQQAPGVPGVATHVVRTVSEATRALLDGCAVVLFDGGESALAWHLVQLPARSVDRSENEPTLHGPQEAFVESLSLNISLLRKRLKSPNLKIETYELGTESPTTVAVLYYAGIVKPDLVQELRRRLREVHVDYVVDTLNMICVYHILKSTYHKVC